MTEATKTQARTAVETKAGHSDLVFSGGRAWAVATAGGGGKLGSSPSPACGNTRAAFA